MKKKYKENIYLFITVLLYVLCITLLSIILLHKLKTFIKPKLLYSIYATEINIEFNDKNNLYEIIENNKTANTVIIKNGITADKRIKGLYYNGELQNIRLRAGRFFTKNECLADNKIAVIGENVIENQYAHNGKSFITVDSVEFEVIGYLGRTDSHSLSNLILIPLKASINLSGVNGQYAIDGKEPKDVKALISSFKGSKNFVDVIYPLAVTGSIQKAFFEKTNEITYIYLILLILLTVFLIRGVTYWFYHKQKKIRIYREQGITNYNIFNYLYRKYLAIILPSTIVGLCCIWVLMCNFFKYEIAFENFVYLFIFDFLLCTIILICLFNARLINNNREESVL